jgi:formate dehydrogenase subunit beta
MGNHWMLDTHGDPLGAVRRLAFSLWQQARLDGMLVPLSDIHEVSTRPCLLEPSGLAEFNPFRPLMTINDARLIPGMLKDHPHERLGVVVRACEMRALAEMAKRGAVNLEHLLTISVDCLGTFPVNDIRWRAERKGTAEN